MKRCAFRSPRSRLLVFKGRYHYQLQTYELAGRRAGLYMLNVMLWHHEWAIHVAGASKCCLQPNFCTSSRLCITRSSQDSWQVTPEATEEESVGRSQGCNRGVPPYR